MVKERGWDIWYEQREMKKEGERERENREGERRKERQTDIDRRDGERRKEREEAIEGEKERERGS